MKSYNTLPTIIKKLIKPFTLFLLIFFVLIMLASCSKNFDDEEIIEPTTKEQNIEISPSPSAEVAVPTPSPTPVVKTIIYNISDFVPLDRTSVTYHHSQSRESYDSFSEYSSEKNGVKHIQNKDFLPGKSPTIKIYKYSANSIELVYIRQDTPFVYNFIPSAKKDGEVLLLAPIEVGHSWEIDGGKSTITAVGHLVELPIGQVRVVEVTTVQEDNTKLKRLFLEEVGLVAEYEYNKNGEIVSAIEAQAYDLERKFEEMITVYYANRSKGIFWVLKRSEIGFNTSMEDVFKNHLQAKPGDLVALGRSVKINKIRLKNNSLRIDFTSDMALMSENSNLNVIDERFFLQAIANTFANYYGVNKVYIDIEGEPYASKTLVLTSDDYFKPNISETKRY